LTSKTLIRRPGSELTNLYNRSLPIMGFFNAFLHLHNCSCRGDLFTSKLQHRHDTNERRKPGELAAPFEVPG